MTKHNAPHDRRATIRGGEIAIARAVIVISSYVKLNVIAIIATLTESNIRHNAQHRFSDKYLGF